MRLLLALAFVTAPARSLLGQSYSGSIRLGFASTTYTGESDTKFDYRTSFTGGASFTYHLNERIGIRPEVLYVIRGAETKQAVLDGVPQNFGARFSVAYVDVPVLLVVEPFPHVLIRPSVFAGVSVGRNVDARLRLISNVDGSFVEESDDSIRKVDHSLVGGVGVGFEAFGQRFFLEARAAKGLLNVRPDRADAPLRNTSWLVMTGIEF